ncbi:matrixin family metalloprotease [Rarobacter faecitabidus]|uniref:matrixin family metalloprotease n=1 Tax=Rarobacter faecitabidus TaxID=13243 RepID=UPI003CCC78AA
MKTAATQWNNTSAPGYFAEHSTSADPEVNVTDGSYNKDAYAWVAFSCKSNGTYTGGEVDLVINNQHSNGLTTLKRRAVTSHELGHAYGLGHVSTGCRIMRSDIGFLTDCSMSSPQTDDVSGVTARYK